jgi:hypothetical protein
MPRSPDRGIRPFGVTWQCVCSMTHGDDILYADPSRLNVIGSRYVVGRMVADYPVLT